MSARELEPGQWVRLRGMKLAGPVREAGQVMVTFFDVFVGEEIRVPYIALDVLEGGELAAFAQTWPRAERYAVSALLRNNPNRRNHTMYIDARPGDRWVVTDGFSDCRYLAADGTEGSKYDDDAGSDEWKARYWLPFSVAARLAADAAAKMIADLPDRFRCAARGDDDDD